MRADRSGPPKSFGERSPDAFVIGRDERGRWLAIGTRPLGVGPFESRADASHVVGVETGHRPGAIGSATARLRLTV